MAKFQAVPKIPFLKLNVESGVYFVRQTFRRLRIPDLFETTKETRLQKARAVAQQRIAEHTAKYLGGESSMARARVGSRFADVIDEILLTVTPSRRLGTQAMHSIYLSELKREWGPHDITRFTRAQWATWLAEFRGRKDRKTFDDYVKHMNLVLRYAYNHRYASHLMTVPPADRKRENAGRVLTQDEISRLWAEMNEETRDQFALSYECMMRLREVLKLTWDRVDFDKSIITLRADDVKTGSKTGKGRSFKASPHAIKRLKARFKDRTSDVWVFPSPTGSNEPVNQNKTAWFAAKRKAGIKGRARWHDLRHTAISKALLEAGASPVHVSEYAGVSIRTIQRVYLHSTAEHTASVALAVKI